MTKDKIKKNQNGPSFPITSLVHQDNTLFELLYDHKNHKTKLVKWEKKGWKVKSSFLLNTGLRIAPYAPRNPLLNQKIILFPLEPIEYGDEDQLINEVRSFIHRYVDVSETFELISTYYVLLSWIYDSFNEIPYLRLRGDYGSGTGHSVGPFGRRPRQRPERERIAHLRLCSACVSEYEPVCRAPGLRWNRAAADRSQSFGCRLQFLLQRN